MGKMEYYAFYTVLKAKTMWLLDNIRNKLRL